MQQAVSHQPTNNDNLCEFIVKVDALNLSVQLKENFEAKIYLREDVNHKAIYNLLTIKTTLEQQTDWRLRLFSTQTVKRISYSHNSTRQPATTTTRPDTL